MTASPFDFSWPLVAALLGLLGVVLVVASLVALFRVRPVSFVLQLVSGTLLAALAALLGTVGIGTAGYRALTHEETAAHVTVRPLGEKRFQAVVRFPDGRTLTYQLAGDEIYIDAHILKWTPLASLMGLHTAYELDRIAGRYRSLTEENTLPRTVHALGAHKPLDLFDLRRRFVGLAPLVDAEYGSASFVPADREAEFDVRISTTGLLVRKHAAGN